MLELAAAAWQIEPEYVLQKAAVRGLPVATAYQVPGAWQAYLALIHEPRKQAQAFWQQAQRQFIDAPGARWLQWSLGVRDTDNPAWVNTGHAYVGAATPVQATAMASLRTMRNATPEARGYARHWLLPGKGWTLLLTIPFYDLPGRICGFFYAGRKWNPAAGDYCYARAPEFEPARVMGNDPRSLPSHGYCEAGIAMASAAMHGRYKLFDNSLLIFDDPVLAVRLQLRFLQSSGAPAPLVAAYTTADVRTSAVWHWVPADKLVFWSTSPGLHTLWQARNARGYVSTLRASEHAITTHMKARPIASWLQTVQQRTASWEECVRDRLRGESANSAENTLLALGLTGGELHQFIADCDAELAQRLTDIQAGHYTLRQIVYNESVVYEDDQGWITQQAFRICNFVLKIERNLILADGRSVYQGHIRFKGQDWDFLVPAAKLDQSSWTWIRKFLQQQHVGTPLCAARWRQSLVDVALRMHPPISQPGCDVVGWDEAYRRFVLPNYSVGLMGDISPVIPCVAFDKLRPATAFATPTPLTAPSLQALNKINDETAIVWAVVLCVLADVVATAMRKPSLGIILHGFGARHVGMQVVTACGCPRWAKRQRSSRQDSYKHHWPLVVRLRTWLRWAREQSAAPELRAVLAPSNLAAHALGIEQQWYSIVCPRQLTKITIPAETIANVCGSYLQDLCQRKFQMEHVDDAQIIVLLTDVANWYGRQGGNRRAVQAARTVLEWPGHPDGSVHFMRLLYALAKRPAIVAAPAALHMRTTDSGVWVAQQPVLAYTRATTAIPVDAMSITQALATSAGLLQEEILDGQLGWTLAADWFTTAWQRAQAEIRQMAPAAPLAAAQ